MLTSAWEAFSKALGLHLQSSQLGFGHMAWRSLVVFLFFVLLLQIGCRRSLGRNAGFDIILMVILGSVLSRAINGQAAFFPTLGASTVLVILHRLLASISFRSHRVSLAVKGSDVILVRAGKIDWAAMRQAKITKDDLLENIRMNGNIGSLDEVEEARLERNGGISVIKGAPVTAAARENLGSPGLF